MSEPKKLCNFKRFKNFVTHPHYFWEIASLYNRWRNYLEDDYPEDFTRFAPFLWAITAPCDTPEDKFAGFVYLENFTGYKAEINVCFEREYWGDFVRECKPEFLNYCFNELGLQKLTAYVYPQNRLVRGILRDAGFTKEGHLHAETLKNGKPQDVEVWAKLGKEK